MQAEWLSDTTMVAIVVGGHLIYQGAQKAASIPSMQCRNVGKLELYGTRVWGMESFLI